MSSRRQKERTLEAALRAFRQRLVVARDKIDSRPVEDLWAEMSQYDRDCVLNQAREEAARQWFRHSPCSPLFDALVAQLEDLDSEVDR